MSICKNETADDFEFIFGSLKKVLKRLFDYEYKPNALQADAAEAITNGFMAAFGYNSVDEFIRLMCWAHVWRACEKKAPNEAIFVDIVAMQLSSSPEQFGLAYKLFVEKWKQFEQAKIDDFLSYFDKVC